MSYQGVGADIKENKINYITTINIKMQSSWNLQIWVNFL